MKTSRPRKKRGFGRVVEWQTRGTQKALGPSGRNAENHAIPAVKRTSRPMTFMPVYARKWRPAVVMTTVFFLTRQARMEPPGPEECRFESKVQINIGGVAQPGQSSGFIRLPYANIPRYYRGFRISAPSICHAQTLFAGVFGCRNEV